MLAACSNVVRLPDCGDCRPVEMGLGEVLEIDLGTDRATGNDPDAYEWVVTESGEMALIDQEEGTRSEDPDEFIGGYSRYVILTFEPTTPGTTEMEFAYVPAGNLDAEPANTLRVTVIVNG
jgi:hypothetical protein